ncbi:putative lipoprotein [Corallococcus coralloides DSM 2259]|uniref:Putative lipoprotein n=1 Tax=Corallococcus coralloides (strain ATCC 25202 / DSM 2259 / NBRC 100086 / M2) TaxID=1144275 RepID=H8MTW1_CORCM|nr:LPS assembly lipoprotein LptE [Corallococcus coralloides]AFE04751.1 putative lipoprotein [Corallococcus coralloides DSM 2259]
MRPSRNAVQAGAVKAFRWGVVAAAMLGAGCGYRFSPWGSALPAGTGQVCAPIFANETAEPGLENLFTSYLRNQLIQAGRLDTAPGCASTIEGAVLNIWTSPTIIPNNYRISTTVRLRLVKEGQLLSETVVAGTEDYLQGRGNVLEAEANRQAALARLAELLMRDGYDRLASTW